MSQQFGVRSPELLQWERLLAFDAPSFEPGLHFQSASRISKQSDRISGFPFEYWRGLTASFDTGFDLHVRLLSYISIGVSFSPDFTPVLILIFVFLSLEHQ